MTDFFIMKLHSVIYTAEAYRPMLRYAWQNAGYDIGEPLDNFTGVIDLAFRIHIIDCAVVTAPGVWKRVLRSDFHGAGPTHRFP